ncbi:MAG: glycosyltransferase [Nitrospirae bacterium]|nr:glycosyltransferase [Candidatus Troglogloeales bacterium]
MQDKRIALVHDWLTGMRGGERCLEAFCELYPAADIYTLLHLPGTVSETIAKHRINTSFIERLPKSKQRYRHYLPLFPKAIASFDLTSYDLILSSSHCVAKGVSVPKGVCHIAYLHTPMRYIWDQYEVYFNKETASYAVRTGMKMVRPYLQHWDLHSNRDIYAFIANSSYVAARIERYYHRKADVIYPPVDCERFSVSLQDDGFYLMVTALVPYKRVDLAIIAFNQLKLPLRIIGFGPDAGRLKALAGPTIAFLGEQSDADVSRAYGQCRALIFPGEEDFGIVPLEAMASGKPVIAYGRGGVTETVTDSTGLFFDAQTPQAIINAVLYFEKHKDKFDPIRIREHVLSFDRAAFKKKISEYITKTVQRFYAQAAS